MARRTTLYVGLIGMLLALAVVLVSLLLTPNSPEEDQSFEDPGAETPAPPPPQQPSPPAKEPPLNR